MGRIQKFICWLVIILNTCNKIECSNASRNEDHLSTYNQVLDILKMCVPDRLNPLIVSNDLIDLIYPSSWAGDDYSTTIMLIDDYIKSNNIQLYNPAYPTYLISADSIVESRSLLSNLQSSSWWNIISHFFVIENRDNLCKDSSKVLQSLWKADLLSSFYICNDSINKTMVYTFNPFTRRAPNSWEEVDSIDKPNDRWTLYKQPLINDTSICQNLTFDKTKFLDGYAVKAVASPEINRNCIQNNISDVKSLGKFLPYTNYMFFKNLFPALNVTPIISYDENGHFVNNTPVGYLQSLVNGTQDIGMNERFIGGNASLFVDFIKIYKESGFSILTHKRGVTTVFEQVSDFFDLETTLFIIFVLFITFVAIIRINNCQYGLGLLDIISLTLSRGILVPLNKLYIRVIFILATFVIFIVTPDLQGYILSFVTKPEFKNVETLEDLYNFKYTVYMHSGFEKFLQSQGLWEKSDDKYFHISLDSRHKCHKKILDDDAVACLALYYFQLNMALANKNLHVSKGFISKAYMSFWLRKNWVLKNKIDEITSRLQESGLIDYWDKRSFHYPFKKLKAIEAKESSLDCRLLDFQDFQFSLFVFSIGLVFCTIVFGIENFVKRVIQKRRRAMRREPRFVKLRQRLRYRDGKIFIINEYL
ncbi:uncharacterized protein LOC130668647 [Microplitis mediator]|uniref:uncharacterized protein LOC130668647 n=1 Tax=Microplitis mediator TaxID=375433 RepID=UPI002552FC8D|nr:uncharacterized protein LOC130668647 [Microplitis mediator]